jgi:hypothetical protein
MQMTLFGEVEPTTTIPRPAKAQAAKVQRPKIVDSMALVERIDDDVYWQLKSATVTEGIVRLAEQLPRDLYERCDEVLGRLRGRWSVSAQGHVFPFAPDATEALFAAMLDAGKCPANNPLALFYTPDAVIEELVRYDLADRLDWWEEYRSQFDLKPLRVLEPSAGTGAIADYIRNRWPNVELHLVEQDPINVEVLRAKGYTVTHADFAEWQPDHEYDIVIMNPPFSVGGKDVYQSHITKAFSHLRSGGLLAAVAPAGFQWRSDAANTAFLNWVALQGHYWDLPDESFKDAGTNVKTCGIGLSYDAQWEEERRKPYCGYRNFDEWLLSLHADCHYEYHLYEMRMLRRIADRQEALDLSGLPSTQTLKEWRGKLEGVRREANKLGDGFQLRNLSLDDLIRARIEDRTFLL